MVTKIGTRIFFYTLEIFFCFILYSKAVPIIIQWNLFSDDQVMELSGISQGKLNRKETQTKYGLCLACVSSVLSFLGIQFLQNLCKYFYNIQCMEKVGCRYWGSPQFPDSPFDGNRKTGGTASLVRTVSCNGSNIYLLLNNCFHTGWVFEN